MRFGAFLLFALLLPYPLQAQGDPGPLRVYLDCHGCDLDLIRREITFVDYVRDPSDADLQVLVTRENAASGARNVNLDVVGFGTFAETAQRAVVRPPADATSHEQEEAFLRILRLTLAPYAVTRSPSLDLDVDGTPAENGSPAASSVEDPWNYWVFSVGARMTMNGESTYQRHEFDGNIDLNRTTPGLKVVAHIKGEWRETRYESKDSELVSRTRATSADLLLVRSISDHWSLGGRGSVGHSSYLNQTFSLSAGPALEYSVWEYEESSRRSFRFRGELSRDHFRYEETTIYGKDRDSLWAAEILSSLGLTQPWGSLSFGANFKKHITTMSRYSGGLRGSANVRVARGLTFDLSGYASWVHDQIYLASSDPTNTDILIRERQFATSYRYRMSAGLSYRFGSVLNNVVNTRF